MRAVRACLAALALVAIHASPALAAGPQAAPSPPRSPSVADREAARALSGKGYEAFEARQWQMAIELFRKAEAHFHAPPHLLYIGRAQFKLGKLLAAQATFQRIVDEKLASDAPGPFKEAQASARSELGEVEVLIPSLVVVTDGEAPPGTLFSIDDRPLDPASFGRPLRADPGSHRIAAAPPGLPTIERTVTLELGGGEETRVSLPFPRRRNAWVTPAVVSFVLGGLGVGAGVAGTALVPGASGSSRTAFRAMQIGGFALGAAGVVAGVVLVTAKPGSGPASASASGPSIRLGVGVGALTLSGSF